MRQAFKIGIPISSGAVIHIFAIDSDLVGILRNSEYESYLFVVWISVVPDGFRSGILIIFPEV